MKARVFSTGMALAVMLSGPLPTFAADSESPIIRPSPTVKNCKKGKVWDKKKNRCVKKNADLDQESLFEAGRDLARAKRYDEAIQVLTLVPDSQDKRVLNMLGFSHRMQGRVEFGIYYYKQAIKIDPDYALVREYFGEALLQKKDLAGAKQQLAELERLCGGTDCREYAELSKQINAFVSEHGRQDQG